MDFFAEKAQQITDGETTAFGIPVCTRYGKVSEMVEMLNFCKLTALKDLHVLVKEVFYDSQASLCTIELHDESDWLSLAGEELMECALQSIRQFQANGQVFHGLDLAEDSDESDL